MKKENILSAIIYLILIAAAIITGSTVVEDAFVYYDLMMNRALFAFICIIVALILNIVCLELFHALGAKIGGYKVTSINIVGFCFEKRENNWKFSFKDFDGLTGETRIVKEKEKANLKPYIWLPLIAYVIEFTVMMLLYNLSQQKDSSATLGWLGVVSILFIIISSMIALYNIVPLKLDTMTDGYRLLLLSKPENIEAFNEWMRVEDLARNGKEIDNIKTFSVINDFTANVNLFAIYELIAKNDFSKAKEVIELMIQNKENIEEETFFKIIYQKLYILLKENKIEEAKECFSKEKEDKLRRFIGNNKTIEVLRAYIMIAGFIEESQSEVDFVLSKKNKALSTSLPTRAKSESVLFDQAINDVYNAHPDWAREQK